MQAVPFPARQKRIHYRHELRTLTYVTIDEANGGIIRNLTHDGAAVQAVGALRENQRVRLRFELRYPRLRVETYGEVSWASSSGQCGIRFTGLPEKMSGQIDEWIFANLLDLISRDPSQSSPMFGGSRLAVLANDDGLMASAAPHPAIRLDPNPAFEAETELSAGSFAGQSIEADWLSRPLSPETIARLVDSLAVVAALLLFAVIFLSITHELPAWPLTLGMGIGAAGFVTAAYWFVFSLFGGVSLGNQLARMAGPLARDRQSEDGPRFR